MREQVARRLGPLLTKKCSNSPQGDIIDPDLIRYFSAPSTNTLYATLGIWDTSEAANPEARSHAFSSHLTVDSSGISARSTDNTTGAWAQVIKSTDGGETWSVVYSDVESGRYPNDIHCYDETRCATVLEATGTTPLILTTTDGGETWTTFEVLHLQSYPLARRHVFSLFYLCGPLLRFRRPRGPGSTTAGATNTDGNFAYSTTTTNRTRLGAFP